MSFITKTEYRAITGLASIFSLRMLGLFMILPIFSLYANQLEHVTPTRVGITLGIYGLTQALLQIPFGFASDWIGRKPMIILGLVLFSVGSTFAAFGDSIFVVMLGRALQGSGAIGCVMMALVSDLTREEVRVRAMAVMGITIGISFVVAMVLGPLLNEKIGIPGIFGLSAILGIMSIGILMLWIPTPPKSVSHPYLAPFWDSVSRTFKDPKLLRLNFGVLVLHASLTALFLKLPIILENLGLEKDNAWQFYIFVLLGALVMTMPIIFYAEKQRELKILLIVSIVMLLVSELGIFYGFHSLFGIAMSLGLFLTAFNFLEASLPSLVSKAAPSEIKGTALGIFSSAQFLGLFLGGFLGGFLDGLYGIMGVFVFCVMLAFVWLALILR